MAAFKQILPQNNQSLSWFPIIYRFTVHPTLLYFRTTGNNTEGRKWMNENVCRNSAIIIVTVLDHLKQRRLMRQN